ncbi:Hypothetical predicted protein [Podarcis lilfordi]|uniref:Uncharacterized protein n=1 Tax=Podarcis lilfordi TaxID=74358 RepID=A0AA35PJM2_9SAUR|nr:Hypothetical predicted protein [Podarcis lilfordi]
MAEAVKPRSRPRSSRGRTKEKKKKSEEEESVASQLSLPDSVRDGEEPTRSCDTQGERLPDPRLCNKAKERENVKDACDVLPSAVTVENEGSPATAPLEPPIQGEEFAGRALQEEKSIGGNPASPQSLAEAVASCDLSESNAPCAPSLLGSAQAPETETVRSDKQSVSHPSEEVLPAVCAPSKEEVQKSAPKMLYPDLPLELFRERLAAVAVAPVKPKERLYPEIPAEPQLLPFTREQLKVFEPCSWLENVDAYVEEFGTVAHQDRHEFFELLLNYWRCRKQLLLAERSCKPLPWIARAPGAACGLSRTNSSPSR